MRHERRWESLKVHLVAVLRKMAVHAQHGRIPMRRLGEQSTEVMNEPLMFFEEDDSTAISLIEPKGKIIWDTNLTGIPNE